MLSPTDNGPLTTVVFCCCRVMNEFYLKRHCWGRRRSGRTREPRDLTHLTKFGVHLFSTCVKTSAWFIILFPSGND